MIKHNQDGAVNGLLIGLIFSIVLLLGTLGFGFWAYTERQDYKDHSDAKVAAAVEVATQQESVRKDKEFAEAAKKPLKTYNGPEASGSIQVSYPKTWSAYIDTTASSSTPVNAYFAPDIVPSINDEKSPFALRIQVTNTSYSSEVRQLSGSAQQTGAVVSAYALPRLPKVVGVKAVGKIQGGKNTTLIVLPLRAQTIKIWTEGDQYLNDFNTNILPNFSFSP